MRERRGVVNVILSAIIGLVLIGAVFSVAFFLYNTFVDALTTSQVTKGFQNFITPIQQVCQGELEGLQGDIALPVDSQYTYGVIQTRLKSYTPEMPLVMRKCDNANCLCLFRLENPEQPYKFWDPTGSSLFGDLISGIVGADVLIYDGSPPPIWHFNPAGLRIFPSFMQRVTEMLIIRVVLRIVDYVLSVVVAGKVCEAVLTLAPDPTGLSKLSMFLCNVAVFTAIGAVSGAALNALATFLEEATEPFLLVNYPLNFMSVPIDPGVEAEKYLYWKNSDIGCAQLTTDHEAGDCFEPALEVAKIDSHAMEAIGLSFAEGALDGAIDGMFRGISAGTDLGVNPFAVVFKNKALKAVFWGGKKLLKAGVKLASWAKEMDLKKAAGMAALDFDFPESFRPKATVRALLGTRRNMNVNDFVAMNFLDKLLTGDIWGVLLGGSTPQPPSYDYSFDDSVKTFDGLDIINCVSISDLGPRCEGNTPVIMDYNHDIFLSYRITDPINFPAKAIFCGYDPEKAEFGFNIVDIAVDALIGMIDDALAELDWLKDIISFLLEGIRGFLNLVVGEWLLAGSHSMQGLFMECVQPHVSLAHKSELFQYWIPYFDRTGYVGNTGSIGLMTARLTTGTQSTCQNGALEEWRDCACEFITWAKEQTSATWDIYNESFMPQINGYGPSLQCTSGSFSGGAPVLIGFLTAFDKEEHEMVVPRCYYDASTESCGTGLISDEANTRGCATIFHPKYNRCIPGLHVDFGGAVQ